MNTCEYYQELISRMLDDELSNRERNVLAEHLSECSECAAVYSAFSLLSDAVATDLVEPPEELAEDVMAHIRRAEIRRRNRRNSRATKNAAIAAACVALLVAAVGGTAVVRSQRSSNAVYETRMSQSAAGASAKEANIDAVIVSEQPVAEAAPVQESAAQYVAPVEKYTAAPQPQEEEKNFFANILPESWFADNRYTPAPTQAPVYTADPYATPAATPYAQPYTAPVPTQNPLIVVQPEQAPIVVVSPPVSESYMASVPAATEAPVLEAPVVTEVPVTEVPVATEAPIAELPVVTEAPVAEMPVVTEAPIVELPVITETPAVDVPAVTEAPVAEVPVITEAPVIEAPATNEEAVFEAPFVPETAIPEAPVMDAPMMEVPAVDAPVIDEAVIEEIPVVEEMPAIEEAPVTEGPIQQSHDFSRKDSTELVNALFVSTVDEAAPAVVTEPSSEESTSEENSAETAVYTSYVDRLLAEKTIVAKPLPENLQPDRIDTLALSQDGMFYTLQVNIYGDQLFVFTYDGSGQPLSFHSVLSVEEFDSLLQLCYQLNDIW